MSSRAWANLATAAAGGDDAVWELFHESSKASQYEGFLPDSVASAWMAQAHESMPFEPYPRVDLPAPPPLPLSLGEAVATWRPACRLEAVPVSREDLSALLHYAYGALGDGSGQPRPQRAVPSQSSLYPLEIFFHSTRVDGLAAGLYHFDPAAHALRFLRGNDQTPKIAPGLVDKSLAITCSLLVFLVAVPERSVLKYGERGYRFVLLEAGAVAQSLNLTAHALGLACVQIGEYFDRQIDGWLGLDGLTMSTVHIAGIGREKADD